MRKILSSLSLTVILCCSTTLIFAQTNYQLQLKDDGQPRNPSSLSPKDLQWHNRQYALPSQTFTPPITADLGGTDVLVNNNNGVGTSTRFTQSGSAILSYGNSVFIAFNDAGSIASGEHLIGYAYSSDGGATFTDMGTLPVSAAGDGGYPVLARNNTTGRIYLACIGFNTGNTIQIFRTDDNGLTWLPPVNAMTGANSEDKPWIAVDNFPGAANGFVYVVSRRFGGTQGLYFTRSFDNGNTFSNPINLSIGFNLPQGGNIAVGPDHQVYVGWYQNIDQSIRVARSTDGGFTFFGGNIAANGFASVNGDLGLTGVRNGAGPAPFRTNGFPQLAVNPVSNVLYITYAMNPPGADKANIYIKASSDFGITWYPVQQVNDDCTLNDQWFPAIAVTPDGNNLGVFYYSREEDPLNNLFRYRGRIASLSGTNINFQPSAAISDVPSYPEMGRDLTITPQFVGDYNTAVATSNGFAVAWSDNSDDLSGQSPIKDPNIYFSSFGVPSACTVPVITGTTVTQPNCPSGKGSIVIQATGTGTLEYSINGPSGPFQTSNTFNNLSAGTYYPVARLQGQPTCITPCTATSAVVLNVVNPTVNTFSYVGPAVPIPDNDPAGVNIILPVSGLLSNIVDLNFQLDALPGCDGAVGSTNASVDHTFNGDLSFTLISPTGISVPLITRRGGGGNNFCTLTLDDEGDYQPVANITVAGAVSGNYTPESPLSAFDNTNGNGNWILNVSDNSAVDVGSVRRFSLVITSSTPCPCTITCPANITVSNTVGQCGAVVNYPAPTTSGGCGTVVSVPASGSFFPIGTTFVTATATGGPSCSFSVTVNDTEAPTINCPADITVSNTPGQCGAIVNYTESATDNCPGVTYAFSPASGSFFPIGTTFVTGTAVDAAGNTRSCVFRITVNDTQAPTVTCPANITVSNTPGQCSSVVTFSGGTATDNCPGVTFSYSPASGSVFPVGNTTVTKTARDAAGNTSTCTFIVRVNDTQAPTVTCPANITVNNTPGLCGAAVTFSGGTATDNCPGVLVSYSPASGSVFPVGTTTVTKTATDASGNTASCTFTVTVNDTQAPVINCPANITVNTPIGSCVAVVNYNVTATDNCPGVTTSLVSGLASGSSFPIGVSTVNWKATDASGNTSTCSFTVTVIDAQLPVINVQPQTRSVCVGDNMNFSVTATNALSYQWQTFAGGTWTNIAGATGSSLSIPAVNLSMNTNTYRVLVNGLCTVVTSNTATVFVNPLPTVVLNASRPTRLLPGQFLNLTTIVSPSGGSFTWFKNGVALTGINVGMLTNLGVEDAGSYRVRYTDNNGCISTSATIDITAEASDQLWVYPNPNNGQFQVRYYNQAGENVTVNVYDAMGRKQVQKVMITGLAYSQVMIDLGLFADGVYLVEVVNGAGKKVGSKQILVRRQ